MNPDPPPIYVGFGSMAARAEKMTRIVVEAVRGAGQRLILASGWANLGGIEPADDLLVIGSVPHDRLFPRMKAVIHHGGAGTTATAARAGIPQIIVPHLLDQFYWAHQILNKRLGPKGIAQSKLSSKSLQKAIETTLANSEFAEKAVRLAGHLENMDGTRQAIAFLNKAGRRRHLNPRGRLRPGYRLVQAQTHTLQSVPPYCLQYLIARFSADARLGP